MHATPNGNHAVAVPRHVARPASHKARLVAAVEVAKAEVAAAARVAVAQVRLALPAQAELITAAQATSNVRPAAHHARFRQRVRQAHVRAQAERRADSCMHALP